MMQQDAAVAGPGEYQFFPQNNEPPITLTTSINSYDYSMNHRHRGYCLILDIENFHPSKQLPRRHGSKMDSTGLYNIFRALSFDVALFKDCTAKEIRSYLDYYSKLDHSDNDCFVCCILTHGEHGQLWGFDAKFPTDLLYSYFTGENCRTLVGKPKMFFIQACQGDRMDHGVSVFGTDSLDSACYFKLPSHADFLVAYSTLPGFFSWRNSQDGSWFIQAVIRVLNEFHNHLDVLSMLTIVNHRVAFYKCSNTHNAENNNKKQVPCITSMLTRRVYLRPKPINFDPNK